MFESYTYEKLLEEVLNKLAELGLALRPSDD